MRGWRPAIPPCVARSTRRVARAPRSGRPPCAARRTGHLEASEAEASAAEEARAHCAPRSGHKSPRCTWRSLWWRARLGRRHRRPPAWERGAGRALPPGVFLVDPCRGPVDFVLELAAFEGIVARRPPLPWRFTSRRAAIRCAAPGRTDKVATADDGRWVCGEFAGVLPMWRGHVLLRPPGLTAPLCALTVWILPRVSVDGRCDRPLRSYPAWLRNGASTVSRRLAFPDAAGPAASAGRGRRARARACPRVIDSVRPTLGRKVGAEGRPTSGQIRPSLLRN